MRLSLICVLLGSVAAKHFLLKTEDSPGLESEEGSDYNGMELMSEWLHGDENGTRGFQSFDEDEPATDSKEYVEINLF